MSGDAQPRKRKNKGKKKEEGGGEEELLTPLKNSTDEVVHVHKDIGLGGNVVTKLIFFGLLATIGVMVGVILLEYRGSTDEETSSAVDSPWSLTLDKWIDKEPDEHAHGHDLPDEEEHDDHEHGEEHEDDGDHDDGDPDESHGDGGGGGRSVLFSWLSFGGDSSSDDKDELQESEGLSFESILKYIPFGDSSDDSGIEEKEEESDGAGRWFGFGGGDKDEESQSAGSWFGFGGGEKEEPAEDIDQGFEEAEEEPEEPEEEDEDEDEEPELDGGFIEGEDELEEEEQENDDEDESVEAVRFSHSRLGDDLSDEEEDQAMEEEDEQDNLSEPEEEIEHADISQEEEEEENDEEKNEISGEDDEDEYNKSNENGEEEEEENDSAPNGEESEEETYGGNKEAVEDKKRSKIYTSEEVELFPEALEALKREAEELAAISQAKEEEENEIKKELENQEEDLGNETEEGEETEGMALKFGVGVALVVVAHVVLIKKWNSWAGEETSEPVKEAPVISEWKEEVAMFSTPPSQAPVHSSPPPPPTPAPAPVPSKVPISKLPVVEPPVEEPAEESPVEEEEDEEEVGGNEEVGAEGEDEEEEEEESEDLEIDKEKFRELIAKYGQDTPESSDIEQSDGDVQKVDYSGGEESGSEGEESPAAEVSDDELPPSEDELKEWTGIKKSDIEKFTKLDSDSEAEEEEEEEEESEDEPPPPPPTQSSRQRGGPKDVGEDYHNAFITNDEDWAIREELDRADDEFNYMTARNLYRVIFIKHPNSPRANYGFALTFDKQAEAERSNQMLKFAITYYNETLKTPKIPDLLFIKTASRLINRLRFIGMHNYSIDVHNKLIQRFNSTPEYRTDLAISYLIMNRLEDARVVLKEVLKSWPNDPTALAHYGLVLKLQGNIHGCIKYLEEGLASEFTTPKDARLFFHLGDALARVGREGDAVKVYDKAVAHGLFRSRYQRSLYNVDRLTARPWWTLEQTTYASFLKLLEDNWIQIRDEGVNAMKLNGLYRDEAEGLRDKGNWKQFELFARGSKFKENCEVTPLTCGLIGSFEPAATCKRGQAKFSVMEGDTHVWPHCGPTNCRLRAHLGLIIPEGSKIRVANITKSWEEGKVFVFDDSFEHEVWHTGNSLRLVLIVDLWHPELTKQEKLSLSAI